MRFGQQHPRFGRVAWCEYLLRMADVQACPEHERHFRAWEHVLHNGMVAQRPTDRAGADAAFADMNRFMGLPIREVDDDTIGSVRDLHVQR